MHTQTEKIIKNKGKLTMEATIIDLQEYADLKIKEKQIKERLGELSPVVTTLLEQIGDKVDVEGGQIGLKTNKSWNYPKYVESKVKNLKREVTEITKIYQIKNPDAYDTTKSPVFYESK